MLLAGVGLDWGSNEAFLTSRVDLDIDYERLDAACEVEISRCVSELTDSGPTSLLSRHLREKEGNFVPKRVARSVSGDSAALLRLTTGKSSSLKNPSARS